MNKLAIAVVSGGRADTLFERSMTPSFLGDMPWFLYVPAKEADAYASAVEQAKAKNVVLRCIPSCLDYHQSLDYTIGRLYMDSFDKALLLDDDRSMTYWGNQKIHKAGKATPKEVEQSILEMSKFVSPGIPLVGCRLRGFCWNDNTPFTLAGKCVGMQMLYLPAIVNRFKFSWAGKSMHDHHMLAQLLNAGYLTLTYNKLLHDDRFGHMAPSGCGQWRTVAMHSKAALLMEREFPNAVRSRLKGWVKGEELHDIVFSAAKLLKLITHIRIFGDKYLNQIRPFVNEKQQDMIDVVLQDYSIH